MTQPKNINNFDDVLAACGINREEFGQLTRRALVPRLDPGDMRLINRLWEMTKRYGFEKEYSELYAEVKRDFMALPMRYV